MIKDAEILPGRLVISGTLCYYFHCPSHGPTQCDVGLSLGNIERNRLRQE